MHLDEFDVKLFEVAKDHLPIFGSRHPLTTAAKFGTFDGRLGHFEVSCCLLHCYIFIWFMEETRKPYHQ